MEVLLLVIGIVAIYQGYPHVRNFFKRLKLRTKIKKKCREKGYTLQETHRFWFLGGRFGKKCDFYIETPEELFAVKLFNIVRYKRILYFTDDNKFFVRKFINHASWSGARMTGLTEIIDTEEMPVLEYDFESMRTPATESKPLHKVLLINPLPMSVCRKPKRDEEYCIFPGEIIGDMEFMNLSGFLIML